MSFFSKLGQNLSKNMRSKQNWTDIAWAVVGGATYILVPTALKGMLNFKIDGARGAIIGAAASTTIGFAFDKPQMALGAIATFGVHTLYVYGNDTIASLFGTPIFAYDKNTSLLGDDSVPPGMEVITLPDGARVLAHKSEGQPMSGYQNEMAPPQLNDYVNEMVSPARTNTLSDFSNEMNAPKVKLGFEERVNSGYLN